MTTPWDSKKWLRKSNELFQFYSKIMADHGYEVSEINHPKYGMMIKDCHDCGLKLGDMRELIEFAVTNWEALRDYDRDGRLLSAKPSLYEMFAGWRFPKWIKLSREGFAPKVTEKTQNEGLLKWMKKV